MIGASRRLGVVAYVCQVVQEVGKALESEVGVGGEGLSGLDPEVVVIPLYAVSPVRGGGRMMASQLAMMGQCTPLCQR